MFLGDNHTSRHTHSRTHTHSLLHTGSYALRVGQTSCVECRPGTYAEFGTAGQQKDICIECEAGKWSSAGRLHHQCAVLQHLADFSRQTTTLIFENVCSWRIVPLVVHSLSNEWLDHSHNWIDSPLQLYRYSLCACEAGHGFFRLLYVHMFNDFIKTGVCPSGQFAVHKAQFSQKSLRYQNTLCS
jgi:hypothetical protein